MAPVFGREKQPAQKRVEVLVIREPKAGRLYRVRSSSSGLDLAPGGAAERPGRRWAAATQHLTTDLPGE